MIDLGKSLASFATDLGVRPRLVASELERLVTEAETARDEASGLRELEPCEEIVTRMRKGWTQRANRLNGWV